MTWFYLGAVVFQVSFPAKIFKKNLRKTMNLPIKYDYWYHLSSWTLSNTLSILHPLPWMHPNGNLTFHHCKPTLNFVCQTPSQSVHQQLLFSTTWRIQQGDSIVINTTQIQYMHLTPQSPGNPISCHLVRLSFSFMPCSSNAWWRFSPMKSCCVESDYC